jgi:hypothetical protein
MGALESEPSLLCNVTTHQYADIKHPQPVKSGCFIATVACGYSSWEVRILSNFRDNVLSRSKVGFVFISIYYKVSPYLAFSILKRKNLKKSIRRLVVSPVAILVSKISS